MNYFTDLFTVDTYETFLSTERKVAGFLESQLSMAEKVAVNDILICYITRLSRWAGCLRVRSAPWVDATPIFSDEDPYKVRFDVEPIVLLPIEQTLSVHDENIFETLSFSKGRKGGYWQGPLRRSLQKITPEDGDFLVEILKQQEESPKPTGLVPEEIAKHRTDQVKGSSGPITVVVPDEDDDEGIETNVESAPSFTPSDDSLRESYQVQAALCRLGESMGYEIWLPRNDRNAVQQAWQPTEGSLAKNLPLNYDNATIKTIENIDVIWLKGRAIRRAFEVEHTTAVYSGLLRMADLLALQPNMEITLHIVAPEVRRERVLRELLRPVFTLIEGRPLRERCSLLTYGAIEEIERLPHLAYMKDDILTEYEEHAQ